MAAKRRSVISPQESDGSRGSRRGRAAPELASQAIDVEERPRKDFLSGPEIERLLKATAGSRYPARDRAIVLVLYRHGLRVSEMIALRLSDLDWEEHRLHVHRLKNGLSTVHPVEGDVMRALRRYLATRTDASPWLFTSERGGQLTRQAVHRLVAAAGERAGLVAWPHQLRHSTGYNLVNNGVDLRTLQDFLGHRDPRHTSHYARVSPVRFERIWQKRR